MSLVSEALKKAEREAAAREARERGLPAPLDTPMQPYRARPGQRRGRRLGFALALLAAGAAATTVVLLLARPTAETAASNERTTVSSPATLPASPPQPVPAAESGPPNSPTTAAPTEPAAPRPVTQEPSEREATPASARTLPSPETASPESAREPTSGEPRLPSQKPSSRASNLAREHVRRVDFADGSKLELGGIAYSDTAPFAYLNGKLLAVGERTNGYTLVRIERDRVVVRGEAGELTLLLKPR